MKFYTYKKDTVTYEKFDFFKPKYIVCFSIVQFIISIILLLFISSFYSTPKKKKLKKDVCYLLNEFKDINKRVMLSEMVLDQVMNNDSIIYESLFDTIVTSSKQFETVYEGDGSNKYAAIMDELNTRVSLLDKNMAKEMHLLNGLLDKASKHQDMLAHIPAIQPIDNKDLKRTASGWGYRIHPIYKIRKFHYGLDFTAPTGTPIYSTGDGVISYAIPVTDRASQGYGNVVIIDHGYGYKTLYGHMLKFNVKVGEKVKRGQIIGYVGSTGLSTGPHLHYEVMKDGVKVNPINYLFDSLTPEEYQRIIEISNSMKKSLD